MPVHRWHFTPRKFSSRTFCEGPFTECPPPLGLVARRRRARPIPACCAEIECRKCCRYWNPGAIARWIPNISSSISHAAFLPSAQHRFAGCRGRRRRQPVSAAYSECDARIAALAMAAITGEPGRGASLNSNVCTHFGYAATPEQSAHIARALLAHPTPSVLARVLHVGATGWSRFDQLGAFASHRRSVKNWTHRESGHPGLSGSHAEFPAWGQPVGRWLANWGLSLPGVEASKTGWTPELSIQALSVLARIARAWTTGWSLVGQLGAFASRRGSVKNWMDRESRIQAWGRKCAREALQDQHDGHR